MSAGKNVTNTIIMGFALFACFIGAGSLVFTPAIGLIAGREWQLALFGFVVPGLLLPIMAFVAVARAGGTEGVTSEMGEIFSVLFTSVTVLCAGLLIALPRTAATIHELGVVTIFGSVPQNLTFLVFFAAVFCFSLNPSTTVKVIGRYLAPVLLLIMTAIIAKGVFYPIDIPADTGISRIFALRLGFIDGYRTLDAFAGLIFSGVIFAAAAALQPDNYRARILMVYGGAVLAGFGLLFINGGLIYLGATGASFFDVRISNAALLTALVEKLFENFGPPALALAAIFACLSTAVGLTAGASLFFSRVTKDRLSYKAAVVITCALSLLTSTLGDDVMMRYAVQILTFIYPAAIVLILLNVFRCPIIINKGTFLGAVYSTLIVSFLEALPAMGIREGIGAYMTSLIYALPLAVHGLAWVTPVIVCGSLGTICYVFRKVKQ
jgi:LIVCS family branched-chain amino acid:cation transporter